MRIFHAHDKVTSPAMIRFNKVLIHTHAHAFVLFITTCCARAGVAVGLAQTETPRSNGCGKRVVGFHRRKHANVMPLVDVFDQVIIVYPTTRTVGVRQHTARVVISLFRKLCNIYATHDRVEAKSCKSLYVQYQVRKCVETNKTYTYNVPNWLRLQQNQHRVACENNTMSEHEN